MRRTNPPSSAFALPPKSWRWSESSSIRSTSRASLSPGPSVDSVAPKAGPPPPEDPRRELGRSQHEQLFVAAIQRPLQPAAKRVGPSRRRRQNRDSLGPQALGYQPAEARRDHPRLAG